MNQPQTAGNSASNLADDSKRDIWDLRWVREPQQDRSARTRAQLLDATETILDKEGIDGLTITKVAKEAGCSVGSLYHHFQDKQTIVYAVLDRLTDEVLLTAEEGLELSRWEGVSLMGILEGYMRYSLKRAKRLPGVSQAQRVLALQDPAIETRMTETFEKIRAMILQLLKPRLGEINHPNPSLAIKIVLSTLHAALNQRSQSYVRGARGADPKQSDESFIQEMLRMSAAYLGIEES
ncbi:MAG: TetR/AcrR family transcriptional regulator [Gammaproteobacteria bacterium]|jgi:AcrR family transcriptional regulator|nr:MAG: TetR/AcrR family transcriptional regulator [Gammaproteobacteria bacterium]